MKIDELKGTTILVVDDNINNLNVVVGHLTRFGLKAIPLKRSEEALHLVEQRQPDNIRLDVRMPGSIDGFETCRRLKANPYSRDIPVIFVTAQSETVDKVTGFYLGGVDYITKPTEVELRQLDKTQLALMVRDNGVGFPPHIYFWNSPSLGLTLVNMLVKQLKGTIQQD